MLLLSKGGNEMSYIPGRAITQIRINETVYKKVKLIAKLENRNVNSQIEYLLKKGVEDYEAIHGEVEVPSET